MEKKQLASNLNLTGIVKFANDTWGTKKTGNPFTIGDIQQYVHKKRFPEYFGDIEVLRNEAIEVVKLYNIYETK